MIILSRGFQGHGREYCFDGKVARTIVAAGKGCGWGTDCWESSSVFCAGSRGTYGFDHAFVLHFSHLVGKPPFPDMEWRHGVVFSSSCAWNNENICVIILPL